MKRIKVGIIGIGDRGVSFIYNFRHFSDLAEVTGIHDTNRLRAEAMAKWHDFPTIPRYDRWEDFVRGDRYDLVLVTTPDNTHPDVIVKSLEGGYHVFAEKPLANTGDGLRRIMEAHDRCGRMLMMGHNMRYSAHSRKMKEIAQRGELGDIKVGVCHHPEHGIRYFRRWHKFRAKTVGLVIHKGCHQLDLMNWILGSYPVEVYAQGDLAVFKGDKKVAGCHVCAELPRCPYARRLDYRSAQKIRDMYIDPATLDGYHRSYCPIGADGDAPDYYLVTVRYANGARASYTEVHFCGRSLAEWTFYGDKATMMAGRAGANTIERVDLLTSERAVYDVPTAAEGGHGGADPVMTLEMITSVVRGESLMPPPEAGLRSAAIGIAAMRSIDERRPVRIEEVVDMAYVKRRPDAPVTMDAAQESMGYSGALGG